MDRRGRKRGEGRGVGTCCVWREVRGVEKGREELDNLGRRVRRPLGLVSRGSESERIRCQR